MISLKSRLGLAMALAATLNLAAGFDTTLSAARAEGITVLTWGGAWETAARKIVDQFEHQSNIDVQIQIQEDTRFGLAKLSAQRDDPQIDVWFSVPDALTQATSEGLLQNIPQTGLRNVQSLPEAARRPTWVDIGDTVYGIAYRQDLVPFDVKTLDDVLDPRLAGKVLVPTATYSSGYGIVSSALLHGGNEENVEPGFQYLQKLKPNIARFFTTGPAAMKLLQSGEGSVALFILFANLRPYLDNPTYKFVLPPGPVITTTYAVGIPSAKHKVQALQFIDYLASAEGEALYCATTLCIPTNPSAQSPKATQDFRPDPARLYRPDTTVINASLPGWDDRFKREIQSR